MSLKRKRVGPEENEPTLTPEQVKEAFAKSGEAAQEEKEEYELDEAVQKKEEEEDGVTKFANLKKAKKP